MSRSKSNVKKTLDSIRFSNIGTYKELLDPEKIGLLFAAILYHEFTYKLSSYQRAIINLTEFENEQIILKGSYASESHQIFHVEASLLESCFREDPWCYTVNFTARILAEIAQSERADLGPIETAKHRILSTKEDTPIYLRSKNKTEKGYLIEPWLKLKGSYTWNTLLYVTLTNTEKKNGQTKLVIESDYLTVCALADKFSINDGYLILKPTKTGFLTDQYTRSGFKLPIRVPLVDFDID